MCILGLSVRICVGSLRITYILISACLYLHPDITLGRNKACNICRELIKLKGVFCLKFGKLAVIGAINVGTQSIRECGYSLKAQHRGTSP